MLAEKGGKLFMTGEPEEHRGDESKPESSLSVYNVKVRDGLAVVKQDASAQSQAMIGIASSSENWTRGDSYRSTTQRECFQFGPGLPYLSTKRWSCPVGLGGNDEWLKC